MTDFDDDVEANGYVSDQMVSKAEILAGLLDGRWTIHHVDPSTGVVWFDQTGRNPAPDYDDLDLIAGAMISDRPEAEPETIETPITDIRAAAWYEELHAEGSDDLPDDVLIRFVDPGTSRD